MISRKNSMISFILYEGTLILFKTEIKQKDVACLK